MQYQSNVVAARSRFAGARALVLKRLAGIGLPLMLSVSLLWPAQAMAQFVLSIDDVSISEGDTGVTSAFFAVRLNSPAPPGGVAFEFSTSDGSASSTDYDGHFRNRGRVSEGSMQTLIEITVFGDYNIEADETFFVNLLNPVGATVGDTQAVGTILDDDTFPRILSVGDAVAVEGDDLHFSIMLDKAARLGGVSFNVTTSNGTAIGGMDYQALPLTRITIPQGERQADVFVASLVDSIAEGEESFHFDINNVVGAQSGVASVLGTITDTAASRPSIDIERTEIVEGDSGITSMRYGITLSEPAAQTVSVDYRSFPDGDVGEFTGRVIFHPGETVKFATLPVAGDTRVEPDLHITVELFNPVNADLGTSHATGIVYNDDTDLSLSPTSLPDSRFGERYDQGLTASGGRAPYTMAITAGALPPGMQLVLSGGRYYLVDTPSSVGTYDFTVTVTDSSPGPVGAFSISRNYTITVNAPPAIVLLSVPENLSGSQFQPFSARIDATGGVAPYVFAVISGSLPNGMTVNADGTLSGTPTENGSFQFTVSATEHVPGIPQTASRDFVIYIAPAPVSLTPPTLPQGYLNESYSHPLTALGGRPPYAFRLSAGTLPPGVQLLSNGAIHGTPTVAGQYRFSVTASDNTLPTRSEATVEYTVDIIPRPLDLNPMSWTPIQGGAAFQTFFSARGGTGPYAFEISAGALPSGLSLTSTGTLQGAPTAIGSFGFDVQVTDGAGATASRTFQLEVVLPIVTIDNDLPDGQVDNPYSQSIYANGGLQPYAFSVAAGALPPGLELDPRGIVIGVPTAAGSYTFTLTVADSNVSFGPVTASRTFTIRIEPSGFVFGPDTLPNARTYEFYQQRFNVLYGVPPANYVLSAGALPPGLFLFNDMLYGTPTAAGSFVFSITGSVGYPNPTSSYTRDYVLVVEQSAIEIYPLMFPEATAGRSYSQGISARGGLQPYRYSLATGALPPGLSLSEYGSISGTPVAAGYFNFTVRVADSASGTASTATRDFSISVALPVVSIFTDRLQPAAVGSNYTTTMTAYGGKAPYSYALTAGTLPAGLQLTAYGHLQGVPDVAGSFEITITATDSSAPFGPVSGSRSYTLVVEPRGLSIYPGILPNATEGTPYSVQLEGFNGVAPYHFSITNGALPPGLSLTADGRISGIPGQPPGSGTFYYSYKFTLSVVDANGVSATFPYREIGLRRLLIGISPETVPAGVSGGAYTHQFTAINATAPYVFSWESGTLPNGLQFDPATATLSGIPLETGLFPFRLRLTDAENRYMIGYYSLDIATPTLTMTPDTLADGIVGTSYAQAFVATGGVAPYRWYATEARNGGILPPGLSLGEDGVLRGVPTTTGTFTFGIFAADNTGGTSALIQRTYTMTIAAPVLVLSPAKMPAGTAGVAYAATPFVASGGIAPYTYSLSGTLPVGLSFDAATRTFSGTPTQSGSFPISVTVTDSTGGTAATTTNNYTLVIATPTLTLTPAAGALPAGTGGTAYSQTFVASGGIAPYTYALTAGALPAGLTFNPATGALSGTPTVAGNFSFSIGATDSTTGAAATATNAYTLAISAPTITINPPTLPGAIFGIPYNHVLTAVGGTAPHTYAVTAGALPAGITLGSDGRFSGAATATGTFNFTVTATDALGFTGTRAYTITAVERPDPTQDPNVRGLLNAQVESTRRFATTQINNFQQRLETLHGSDQRDGGMAYNLSFQANNRCIEQVGRIPGQPCDKGTADDVGSMAGTRNASANGNDGGTPFGAWVGGAIRSGNIDGRGGSSDVDFETDGVSVGLDYRFSPRFAFGGGLGYGRDSSEIGNDGARSDGTALTAALYGSFKPGGAFFLDGLFGYQRLDFDLRRTVALTGNRVRGSRDGSQWFASFSAGADLGRDAWGFTPYGRVDIARATLDAYVETGDPLFALRYEAMDVDTTTGTLGLRIDYRKQTSWGSFSPQFRAEYQHDFKNEAEAVLRYADLIGQIYRTDVTGFDKNRFVIGLGALFDTDTDWSFRIEYRGQVGGDDTDHGLLLNVQKKY